MITSLNLNHAEANSAYNFQNRLIKLYFTKLIIQDENGQHSDLFKLIVVVTFNRYDFWVKIYLEN